MPVWASILVVHVAYADALAYAGWAGKALPSEAEWEFAAGSTAQTMRGGRTWRRAACCSPTSGTGCSPSPNQMPDGWLRTSPVGTYPAKGYGLSDMIGNMWE